LQVPFAPGVALLYRREVPEDQGGQAEAFPGGQAAHHVVDLISEESALIDEFIGGVAIQECQDLPEKRAEFRRTRQDDSIVMLALRQPSPVQKDEIRFFWQYFSAFSSMS